MRVKTVKMEGAADLMIGPLTVDQVEAFWPPQKAGEPGTGSGTNSIFEVVVAGLNNAASFDDSRSGESKPWTVDRVRKDLDWPHIHKIHDEILEHSGLRVVKQSAFPDGSVDGVSEAGVKGEAEAASQK